MKWIRIAGVAVGAAIIALLIHQLGWNSIVDTLGWLKWGYIVVLTYPLTWIFLNTTSWRCTLPLSAHDFPFLRLMGIRMAGESFNSMLPSGYVGGEALKAKLLGDWIPLREATSSVLIAKSSQSVALVIFVALGLSVGHTPGTSLRQQPAVLLALLALTVGISIFTILLASGSFSRLARILHRVTRLPWLQRQEARLLALDESLGRFYRESKGRFAESIVWVLGGWLAGAMELVVIFFLIGHPIDWRQAWFMGALAQLAAIIGLFAPAGIGFFEGGHFLAAKLLGLPPALAVGVSLIRRIREIFWDAVGVWLFWKLSKQSQKSIS